MVQPMTPREALVKAISVLGSQTAVAAAAGEGVETGHVYHWLNKAPEVPAKYCPGIERATRAKEETNPGSTVYCEQLCPGTDWASVRTQNGPPKATGKRAKTEHAESARTTQEDIDRRVLRPAVRIVSDRANSSRDRS